MRVLKESNSHFRFWRPTSCHWTKHTQETEGCTGGWPVFGLLLIHFLALNAFKCQKHLHSVYLGAATPE